MDARRGASGVEATAPVRRAAPSAQDTTPSQLELDRLRNVLYRPGAGRADLERFVAAAARSATPERVTADEPGDGVAAPVASRQQPSTATGLSAAVRGARAVAVAVVLLAVVLAGVSATAAIDRPHPGGTAVGRSAPAVTPTPAASGADLAGQGGRVLLNVRARGPRSFTLPRTDHVGHVVVYISCPLSDRFAWFLNGRGPHGAHGVGLDAGHGVNCTAADPSSDALDPAYRPETLQVLIGRSTTYTVLVVAYEG